MKFDFFFYIQSYSLCVSKNTDLFTICKEGIFVSVHSSFSTRSKSNFDDKYGT